MCTFSPITFPHYSCPQCRWHELRCGSHLVTKGYKLLKKKKKKINKVLLFSINEFEKMLTFYCTNYEVNKLYLVNKQPCLHIGSMKILVICYKKVPPWIPLQLFIVVIKSTVTFYQHVQSLPFVDNTNVALYQPVNVFGFRGSYSKRFIPCYLEVVAACKRLSVGKDFSPNADLLQWSSYQKDGVKGKLIVDK